MTPGGDLGSITRVACVEQERASVPEWLARLRNRFPKVALAHEWLTIPGGSEKVVLALLELFPEADLFTSVYDPAPWPPAISDRRVRASFLDRIPRASAIYPKLLPLMDRAFRSFDLRSLRPRLIEQPCVREERPQTGWRPTCLLLPHPDALRLGSRIPRARGHWAGGAHCRQGACAASAPA